MTEKEIMQALRCRDRHEKATNEGCKKCPYWAPENLEEWQKLRGWTSCKVYQIISDAADAIERMSAERDALPCKVYETDGVRVYEHAVRGIIYRTADGPDFDKSAIGKSIFLTREEAERALQEMEELRK